MENSDISGTIGQLQDITAQMLAGKQSSVAGDELLNNCPPELRGLAENILRLQEQHSETNSYISSLARGLLETPQPIQNPLSAVFKEFHTQLIQITWQIKEIAKGDYTQHLSFAGDISAAINKLVYSLQERDILLQQSNENQQLFKIIFDTSPDGMLTSDLQGNIQFISDSGLQMHGFTVDDVAEGVNLFDYVEEEYKQKAVYLLTELLSGNPSGFSEYQVHRKDGSLFWNESNANVIYDQSGKPKGFFIIFRDVTQRKMDEVNLIKNATALKEANALKDKFFSIIAHDLKNPFHIISNITRILREEFMDLDEKEKLRLIGTIGDSAANAFKLLSNLLEWTLSQTGRLIFHPEFISLRLISMGCVQMLAPLAHTKQITLQNNIPADVFLTADRNMLETIIRNLLSNAIKFTPEHGTVLLNLVINNSFYEVSVVDSGIGLSKEDILKLFRIDVKNSEIGEGEGKGTGLGLILSKEFVTKQGGDIWVTSEPGHGSTFTFSIPREARHIPAS